MITLAKTIKKVATRRKSRTQNLRRQIDHARKIITAKSKTKTWEGTKIVRETRDAR